MALNTLITHKNVTFQLSSQYNHSQHHHSQHHHSRYHHSQHHHSQHHHSQHLTVSIITVSIITVSIITVSIITVSIITVGIITVSIITVSIITVSIITVGMMSSCDQVTMLITYVSMFCSRHVLLKVCTGYGHVLNHVLCTFCNDVYTFCTRSILCTLIITSL